MIKARKQDTKALNEISRELSQGLSCLMSNRYELMRPSRMSSTNVFTAPYYLGEQYTKTTKEIGNELVPMWQAIKRLKQLLEPDS